MAGKAEGELLWRGVHKECYEGAPADWRARERVVYGVARVVELDGGDDREVSYDNKYAICVVVRRCICSTTPGLLARRKKRFDRISHTVARYMAAQLQ